jgi:hypothetical protein
MLANLIIVPVVSLCTKKFAFSKEHIATIFDEKQTA